MRNLLGLLLLALVAFYGVGLFVAPGQPPVREWYLTSACPQVDKLSPELCGPIRKAQRDPATAE